MPSRLILGLKILMWVALFVLGVVVIRFGGELVFYLPGAIAKRISLAVTGSERGVLTNVLFYLVAAVFVLAFAGVGWGIVLLDQWRDRRRAKPEQE